MGDFSKFESNQQRYYLNEINRAIPTSVTPDASTIQAALGIMDPYSSGMDTSFDPSQFTSSFNKTNTMQKDAECRKLTAPSVGMRDAAARTGCGWWFTPSQHTQSVGAYGTRRGPMNPNLDTQYGTGEWIWNATDAVKKEGMKAASQVKSCEGLAYATYPNLGWCRSTQKGIVLDGNGKPAYPSSPGGDCPTNDIATSVQQCSPTWACKGLGSASDDNSIRLYSQGECNSLGGIYYGNGECIKQGGGSWSWDCRSLNGGAAAASTDICAPTNGKLSSGCLKSIVQGQCNASGTLATALSSGYAGADFSVNGFNDMNSILAARGFNIPSGIINDGNISVQAAVTATTKLKGWASDPNPRTAGAAQNLCFGTAYDACGFTATDQKPFSATCIARVAITAGWAANGTAMPTKDGMANWRSLNTWADVLAQISNWKNLADTPGPNQLAYIHKVYGPLATYPDKCNFSIPIYKSAVTFLPLKIDAKDVGKQPGTATTMGSIQYTTVGDKMCAYFNNSMSNYIKIPNIVDVNNFSFSFTFNVPTGDYYTMVSLTNSNFDPSVQCDLRLPGKMIGPVLALPEKWYSVDNRNGSYQNNNPLALNTWYTMTVVVTGSSATTYLNGLPYNTITGAAPLTTNPTWFLGRSGDPYRAADVYICDFAVWNTALTAAEAATLIPKPQQTAYGNNGTVSCETYCGGIGRKPWNSELPASWNGSSCVSSNLPDQDCYTPPGFRSNFTCVCTPNGRGWN